MDPLLIDMSEQVALPAIVTLNFSLIFIDPPDIVKLEEDPIPSLSILNTSFIFKPESLNNIFLFVDCITEPVIILLSKAPSAMCLFTIASETILFPVIVSYDIASPETVPSTI